MSADLLIELNLKNAELQDSLTVAWARITDLESANAELKDREKFSRELLLKHATHKYSNGGELIELTRDVTDRVVALQSAIHRVCTDYAGDSGTSVNAAAFEHLAKLWKTNADQREKGLPEDYATARDKAENDEVD